MQNARNTSAVTAAGALQPALSLGAIGQLWCEAKF